MEKVDKEVRNTSLDAITGILIIHMILGHIYQHAGINDSLYDSLLKIFSFFMAWFFFKAGMFYKKKPLKEIIRNSIKRLLIPFLIFSCIGEAVLLISNIIHHPEQDILHTLYQSIYLSFKTLLGQGSTPGNLALWFLLTLFVVRVIWAYLSDRANIILIGGVCMIAPTMYLFQIHSPLYIANISEGVIWYGMGYALRNFKINDLNLSVALVIVYLISIFYFPNIVTMRSNSTVIGNYLLSFPQALLGIIAINSLFDNIPFKFSIFQNIGRNSMGYYCIHWIVLIWAGIFFDNSAQKGYEYISLAIISCCTLLPISIYLIKQTKWKTII